MEKRNKYIRPEIRIIEMVAEPFMNQSGPQFTNKPGIHQSSNNKVSSSPHTFWNNSSLNE